MKRKSPALRILLSTDALTRLTDDVKLHAILRTGVESEALAIYAPAGQEAAVEQLQNFGCPVYAVPLSDPDSFDYTVDADRTGATRLSYETFQKHVRGLVLGG